jgi:hypothetical protein
MPKPAIVAFLIQLFALLISGLIYSLLSAHYLLSIAAFLFLQATLALSLSWLIKADIWWRYIHFGFPLLVGAVYYLHLPNIFYGVGFVLSVALFWTTYASQVPFYPSRPIVYQELIGLLPDDQKIKLIDIGSGMGGLCLKIALAKPEAQVTGIEIAPLPWLISTLRATLNKSRTRFKLGNYNALNFADYDVIFAYLSPAAMSDLWCKAQAEMRPQTVLLSYEFEIPNVRPDRIIPTSKGEPAIFLYRLPA